MTDTLTSDSPKILPKFQEGDIPEMAARIMTVALELFAQKGYAATSVREIVQKADVTNPMLYYYFNSKAGLFTELVDQLVSTMYEDVIQLLAGADSLVEKLTQITWMHLEGCREAPIALKFVYSVLFGPEASRPEADIFTRHVCVIGAISQAFEEAVDAGELVPHRDHSALFLTHQYFGLINGHLMRALKLTEAADNHREYLDELLSKQEGSRLVDFFLNGAGRIVEKEQS
jgi:AcrR family transcriptional regulator